MNNEKNENQRREEEKIAEETFNRVKLFGG